MIDFDPPLRLHLDSGALVTNWRFLKAQGDAACGAAVKANGYGLGAREVVTRLRDAGCRDFFVAHWAEAAAIADLVPPSQVAVLNGIDDSNVASAHALGAIPVLNTPTQVALWKAAGGGSCHVMLDSGMNRLGIGPEQFSRELFDGLEIDIAMAHLASADEDSDLNDHQLALFSSMAQQINVKRRSMANSAGTMLGKRFHFDVTRPGIALYGGVVRPEFSDHIASVVSISARILQIRQLQTGESVGYNATHICAEPTRVATLAIGYGDGYMRAFSAVGSASADGIELPLIGRVSMDLITVDVTNARHLGEGDWVKIDYDLPKASRIAGLSQYELLTVLGDRFERCWT